MWQPGILLPGKLNTCYERSAKLLHDRLVLHVVWLLAFLRSEVPHNLFGFGFEVLDASSRFHRRHLCSQSMWRSSLVCFSFSRMCARCCSCECSPVSVSFCSGGPGGLCPVGVSLCCWRIGIMGRSWLAPAFCRFWLLNVSPTYLEWHTRTAYCTHERGVWWGGMLTLVSCVVVSPYRTVQWSGNMESKVRAGLLISDSEKATVASSRDAHIRYNKRKTLLAVALAAGTEGLGPPT